MDWSNIEHFTEEEFKCPCCGEAPMDQSFMESLDFVRDTLGFPFIITSGYRCPDYNDSISSTGRDGPHTTGKAADIALSYGRARQALDLLVHEFNGLGLKQHGDGRFIHVDLLESRVWTYS